MTLYMSNVCRLRIIKTRIEQGRPGTEATYYTKNLSRIIMLNGNRHGRLICKALIGLHNNVLLGFIIICNKISKSVNENIT